MFGNGTPVNDVWLILRAIYQMICTAYGLNAAGSGGNLQGAGCDTGFRVAVLHPFHEFVLRANDFESQILAHDRSL